MFSSQLQFKFTSVAQAKIAPCTLSQMLKEKISTFDIHGLQVTVGKDGDLAVNVRFDDMSALNNFERQVPEMLEDTKQAFVYKQAIYFFFKSMSDSYIDITQKVILESES